MNVSAFCDVVVWEGPELPNGEITGYEVMFTFTNGSFITIPVHGNKQFLIISVQIPQDEMWIKVIGVLRQQFDISYF